MSIDTPIHTTAPTVTHASSELHSFDEIFPDNVPTNKIWQLVLKEKQESFDKINEYIVSKVNPDNVTPENPHLKYLNETIFPLLLPILEKTLFKAIRMECLTNQKSLFNGIDYISERLWLTNPRHPERANMPQNIFLLPWVQEWLKEHPRLIFPMSWIWTKEEAALIIQAYMRGHFVRKREDVQEMRQFWKILAEEKKGKEAAEQKENKEVRKSEPKVVRMATNVT